MSRSDLRQAARRAQWPDPLRSFQRQAKMIG